MECANTTCLCDRTRLLLFSAIPTLSRRLQDPSHFSSTDGLAWYGTSIGDSVVALTSVAGWWFDPCLRQHYQETRSSQRPDGVDDAKTPLERKPQALRFGPQSERLLWLIHRRVLQLGVSSISLADFECANAIWGPATEKWPKHWRGNIARTLDSLMWLHVVGCTSVQPPTFGLHSALLVHTEDLRETDRDACEEDCLLRWSGKHHHYRVSIGPGFLGALEGCATSENEYGVRTYAVFDQRKLSRLGRKGHLASIFLPAKLGSPAMCRTLTDNQHRLLQAIIQETTRNRKGNHNETTTAAIAENANVPDFWGRPSTCPLLEADSRYIVFGGNGMRPGRGYLISSKGGWCKKANYDCGDPRPFLSDLIELASQLNLVVVGATSRPDRWFNARQIFNFASSQPGRRILECVHLRIYAPPDCWHRWAQLFDWNHAPQQPPGNVTAEDIALALPSSGLSQREFANLLHVDPSQLSRFLSGARRMPLDLVTRSAEILRFPNLAE